MSKQNPMGDTTKCHSALIHITADSFATRDVIGGKAFSLQQMTTFGLAVPSAHVLTTFFFAPWFSLVQHFLSWHTWRAGPRAQWPTLCAAVSSDALALTFTGDQMLVVDQLLARIALYGPAQRFAVRSSSPDEDTAGASFAGLYKTELGVAPGELKAAILRCFAACLDYRVVAYKAAQGIDVCDPRMAVIVQEQIDSDVAGVGFSIDPLTNDFDEAVVDANWGLGESVVSGIACPDHFILDKYHGAVIERQLGAKHVSVTLSDHSETTTAPHAGRADFCLRDAQLHQLSAMMCKLEALYGYPIDMEWAYANDKLFILQARPITTLVPLPAEMLTAPGERRALYMDIARSKRMTSNAPISPIGLDWFAGDVDLMAAHCIGGARLDLQDPDGLLYVGGSRMRRPVSLAEGSRYCTTHMKSVSTRARFLWRSPPTLAGRRCSSMPPQSSSK